ncbi:hypothetical protein SCHPADRAFT_699865 [Schizopora paradoxa]|uniref:F-box domain-containing protein n=1 Tax=Schizopora paradoxa TaxID=27342 RepID=A0A0H2RMR6_9AGAM|nr:hypothetical protein SCHPADRAFT_699865 [Schizopora paradoxa]
MQGLPTDVLDRIFKRCEDHLNLIQMYLPKSRLHPLLFVCRQWHRIAERRLYSSVGLGYDRTVVDRNGQEVRIRGVRVCGLLYRTVQDNPRVASLVRELRIYFPEQERSETKMRIDLIGFCENVEHINLQFDGCEYSLLGFLRATLAKVDLVSFRLRCTEDVDKYDKRTKEVLTLQGLMRLLPAWPRLEILHVSLGDEANCRSEVIEPPASLKTSPTLRIISISHAIFDPTHLRNLACAAPRIEDLSISVRNDCCSMLQSCLDLWSSTLKRLALYTNLSMHHSFIAQYPPIITSPMVELRELYMRAPLLNASAFAFLPKLEALDLTVENYSDGRELIRSIEVGQMPCLSIVHLKLSGSKLGAGFPFDPPTPASREDVLQLSEGLQRVCGARSISVSDYFSYWKIDSEY